MNIIWYKCIDLYTDFHRGCGFLPDQQIYLLDKYTYTTHQILNHWDWEIGVLLVTSDNALTENSVRELQVSFKKFNGRQGKQHQPSLLYLKTNSSCRDNLNLINEIKINCPGPTLGKQYHGFKFVFDLITCINRLRCSHFFNMKSGRRT